MIVPQAAIEAAAGYVSRRIYGQPDGPDEEDLGHGRELVLRVAGIIIAAERARIRSIIDPAKLEDLATRLDEREIVPDGSVQTDLRLCALVLSGGEPAVAVS